MTQRFVLLRWVGSSLMAGLMLAQMLGACDGDFASHGSNISDADGTCGACLRDLAACASTSRTDKQFVECRDLFQSCQEKGNIKECGSPRESEVCKLCLNQNETCKKIESDPKKCSDELGVCTSYLSRRSQSKCSGDGAPPADTRCDVCTKDLASCVSNAKGDPTPQACEAKFAKCKETNELTAKTCADPTDQKACELCTAARKTCVSSGGQQCEAAHAACVAALASSPNVCGQSSSSSSSSSGTGGGAGSCAHSACITGPKLTASCSTCVSQVCAKDSYCCNTAYDAGCINVAQTIAACGCQGGGTCAHNECSAGVALTASCSTCASKVCASDPYCCQTQWDADCANVAKGFSECGCAGSCSHTECTVGTKLNATCSPCAAAVCNQDPYCCNTTYDADCVAIAQSRSECGC